MIQSGTQIINLLAAGVKDELHFGWTEWSGVKSTTVPIKFPEPFDQPPIVTLGLVGVISMQGSNSFGAKAVNITPTGFDLILTITPTDNTQQLKFQWLAIAA